MKVSGAGEGDVEGFWGAQGDPPIPCSWHTCRQKQQLAKARAGELGTAPEGEKLHSDSGVFLDTHSLQEPHQHGKGEQRPPRPGGGTGFGDGIVP